ncbi:hypothetical protein KK083_26790 [Fulvivirgaceae bacterium PWU4]|uniref:Polysaccharide (De)acetylase n=1 Tax=Chryseosolibacter histidini TaxID=2782349 RepID=A0AAP2GLV3_9BACT|nr:hypothetical protein [Chryseosolibacter histidini]MBT1700524.1 hypothetical protein [Chryseosolibacter histidini]
MNIRTIGASVMRNLRNIPGWTSRRKIVVIESDDWGSIRVPSKEVYERFLKYGFKVTSSQYNRLDCLESNEDLESLFEVLSSSRDKNGNPAVLTANAIMANPDFRKIKDSGYREYHYEHFTETLKRYPCHNKVFQLYEQGQQQRLFRPQFHGREHLNISRWMKALQQGGKDVLFAFDQETTFSGQGDYSFMEAMDMDSPAELDQVTAIAADGLQMFRKTFGYASQSFIAPCYTWDSGMEGQLAKQGVSYLQGSRYQYIPNGGFDNYKKASHYLGKRNDNNLIYLVRNSVFEPGLLYKSDWVDYTLASINDAFRWNKPAIICSHRINFIGTIDPANRDNNLKMLRQLLSTIVKKWPDVEFMSSDELGDLIKTTTSK